jgi:hypothetical protein
MVNREKEAIISWPYEIWFYSYFQKIFHLLKVFKVFSEPWFVLNMNTQFARGVKNQSWIFLYQFEQAIINSSIYNQNYPALSTWWFHSLWFVFWPIRCRSRKKFKCSIHRYYRTNKVFIWNRSEYFGLSDSFWCYSLWFDSPSIKKCSRAQQL